MNLQIEALAGALALLRKRAPVVHAVTNWVTAGDVANGLHALGARPVMASAPEEASEVVSGADALVLNLGTPDPSRVRAMLLAGHRANTLGRPIVFDPVGAGASSFRTEAVRSILSELRITAIRGNKAEIGAITEKGGELRGIDAQAGPPDLLSTAGILSRRTGAVVAATGPHDLIVSNEKSIVVENGHPIMSRVTGTGCILSAVIAAFAAVETDPFIATVGAVAFFGLAGERAALRAKGPGTFKAALFDLLYELSPDDLEKGAKLKE